MITLRRTKPDDAEFLYQVHKAALKPYIDLTWGWDEEWQHRYWCDKAGRSTQRVIVYEGVDVGLVDVEQRDDSVFLASIEIQPEFQQRGIGSQVIENLLLLAADRSVPVVLQVLKVNPRARELYERLGFTIVGESSTHYLMRADPRAGAFDSLFCSVE